MAELFRESFDNLIRWYQTLTGPPLPTIIAARNGNGLRLNSAAVALRPEMVPGGSQTDTFTVGFAFRPANVATTFKPVVSLLSDSGNTTHVTLRTETTGAVSACRGTSNGTVLGTSATGLIAINTWYYVEVSAKLSDTVGTVDVHINGASVLSLTAQDTKNAGTKTVFDSIGLPSTIAATTNEDYDDLYLRNDATFNGDIGAVAAPTSQARVARATVRALDVNAPIPAVSFARAYRFTTRVLLSLTTAGPPSAAVQVWNGSAWVSAPVKVWNGSAFVDAVGIKTWNGSAWV